MANTYSVANASLGLVPNMQGFFQLLRRELDQHLPEPEISPTVDGDAAESGMSKLGAGLAVAGAAIGVAVGAALIASLDVSKAQSKLAAQLGGSASYAKEIGGIAGQLYSEAYGDSLETVNEAVRNVIQSGAVMEDASNDQIKSVTANVLDLADAFGLDVVGATEAISAMVRNKIVPDAGAAADVITRMFQQFGPGAEDVLDTFQEYSVQFSKIGIDAQTAGGLIAQAMAAGARDTDIAADAIKEFSIRSIDGSKLTVESYEAIGLNAKEMQDRILAGGPSATAAFTEIIGALKSVEDPFVQSTAAVGLFGTQAEDMGASLYAFDPSTAINALGNVEGAASRLGTTLADNTATRIETFKRSVETGITDFLGGTVIPAIEGFSTTLTDMFGPNVMSNIGTFTLVAGGLAAVILGITAATWLWSAAVGAWGTVTAIATGIQTAFNAVMLLNPIGLLVAGIVLLVGAIVLAYQNFEGFRNFLGGIWEWIKGVFAPVFEFLGSVFAAMGDAISSVWTNVLKPVFDAYWTVVSFVAKLIAAIVIGTILFAWDLMVAGFQLAYDNILKPLFDAIGVIFDWLWLNVIKPNLDFIGAAWQFLLDSFDVVYKTVLKPLFDAIGVIFDWLWLNVIKPNLDFIGIAWGKLAEGFDFVYKNVIEPIFGFFAGAAEGFKTTFNRIVDGIASIWATLMDAFKVPVRFIIETVWNQGIGGLWNRAKSILPLGDFPSIGLPPGFAEGGAIRGRGTGTSDSILARLSAGEHVWTAAEVNAAGGHGFVSAMRDAALNGTLPQFAEGGPVYQQLFRAVSSAIPGTRLTSGLRPGDRGFHGRGEAADLSGARPGDAAAMRRINLWIAANYPNSSELIYTPGVNLLNGRKHTYNAATQADHFDHVHWAMKGGGLAGGSKGVGGGVFDLIGDAVRGLFDLAANGVRGTVGAAFPGNGTLTGDLPKNFTEFALTKTRDLLFGKASEIDAAAMSAGGNGGGGVQQWRAVVTQALNMLGLSPLLADTTLRRMNQESGGNPRAINNWDSNAKRGTPSKGLMQVIDPTFASNRDSRAPNDIWNPLSNVLASMKYATKRYGNLSAAYNRVGGYDSGGWLMPGSSQVYNGTGKPEAVFTQEQWGLLKANLNSSGGDNFYLTTAESDPGRIADELFRKKNHRMRSAVG